MRSTLLSAAVFLSTVPSLAAAQLSNHAISVETGLSTPLTGRGAAAVTHAVAASTWLAGPDTGDLDGVLRIALASAPQTDGRAAARLAATAGLRLSVGRAPLRPRLLAELGWARLRGAAAPDRVAYGLGAALEWFPAPDLSIAAHAALRGAGGDLAAEAMLGLAAYF